MTRSRASVPHSQACCQMTSRAPNTRSPATLASAASATSRSRHADQALDQLRRFVRNRSIRGVLQLNTGLQTADMIAALIVHNASWACNDQSPSQRKVAALANVPKSQG